MYYSQKGLDNNNNMAVYEQQLLEEMTMQERIAIQAIVSAHKQNILSKNVGLSSQLTQLSQAMKEYASVTFVANIEEGFEGNAAEQAKNYLTVEMTYPTLISPIKE
ncbi:TPA: hypothetical protein TXL57_000996 [Streptococcus suis]|nr:hypothetical protein [Streptococcus suis]